MEISVGDHMSKLYRDLEPLKDRIRALVDLILQQEISQYPIVVFYKEGNPELGVALPQEKGIDWNIRLSFLEDFVQKGLIEELKVDGFIKVFKPTETHACLFVLNDAGANFVFYPLGEES